MISRSKRCRRTFTTYTFCATLLCFIITLYLIHLRQNKHVKTKPDGKPIGQEAGGGVHGLNNAIGLQDKLVNSFQLDNKIQGLLNRIKWDMEMPAESTTLIGDGVSSNGLPNVDPAAPRTHTATPADIKNDVTEQKALNVYIVEEHHEVIPYWFGEAEKGIIPRERNTLIHIDGHSDLAPPEYSPGYPFFTWPRYDQRKYLMQGNDIFLQSAAMAGLIDRIVWVWPDWDKPSHESGPYQMDLLKLGWAYITEGNQTTDKKTFCTCMESSLSTDCLSNHNAELEGNESGEEGYEISEEKCFIERKVIIEDIHENEVITYLSESWLLPENGSIMLDIDEDYFGCAYAIQPLLDANVSQSKIYRIDKTISRQFCPLSIKHEAASDEFLVKLIGAARAQKACENDHKLDNSTICLDISKVDILRIFEKLLKEKVSQQRIFVCDKASDVSVFVKDIQRHIKDLSIKQLDALMEIGFCRETSSKSFTDFNVKFSICYGANTPEESLVLEHIPSQDEILRRTEILKNILSLKIFSPNVVTVCRSMRDGYTPRSYFELIENNILTTLNTALNRKLNIHYDVDLIGGKQGWPSRHKKLKIQEVIMHK